MPPIKFHEEASLLVDHRWESLDSNILREIFSKVPIQDLLLNVSSVCQSWEGSCWDILFWSQSVLDLSGSTDAGFGIYVDRSIRSVAKLGFVKSNSVPEKKQEMAIKVMRRLQCIMEGDNIFGYPLQSWRLSVHTIILPNDLQILDTHLLYIAQRTPYVKHLVLLNASRITNTGFIKAVQNWKHIKKIHLGPLTNDHNRFARFIEAIGVNCKDLQHLHMHETGFITDKRNALVIADCLPGLKILELDSAYVFASGVATLLKKCKLLQVICFSECQLVNCYEPSRGFEKHVEPTDSFWLNWTDAKWEVKLESMSQGECHQGKNTEMQCAFEWWMYVYAMVTLKNNLYLVVGPI